MNKIEDYIRREYRVEGRNGYWAIDEYLGDRCMRNVHCFKTKREANSIAMELRGASFTFVNDNHLIDGAVSPVPAKSKYLAYCVVNTETGERFDSHDYAHAKDAYDMREKHLLELGADWQFAVAGIDLNGDLHVFDQ